METRYHLQMIKTIGALWLILSVCGTLPAAESKKSGDTAEFKDLIRQYYAAWSSGSPENPARLYAKDSNLVFYDVAPLKYIGWDEYKQGVQKNLFDNMVSATLTPKDDLVVTRRGNVAWTTVTGHLSAKMKDGKGLEADTRQTAIWEKRGGKWLIVHEHVSVPMQ